MAKERYRDRKFGPVALALIARCDAIIDEYLGEDLRLTLRQLYYQLVSRNVIPNEEKSYKNLGKLVSDARLAGLLDWDAIEDRGRQPRRVSQWGSIQDLVEAATAQYRLPRWEGQSSYVELWVEKEALAGVLQPLAREHHVTLMVNKGYSSQSAMHEAAGRFLQECYDEGLENQLRTPRLFYLGDHDPSGEDMVRDVRDRLVMFGVDVEVTKLALTWAQIEQYHPPPNPAKHTDSRFAAYQEKYGDESWEVDALPPNVLARIIRTAFRKVIDKPLMDEIIGREEEHRAFLRKAAASWKEKS